MLWSDPENEPPKELRDTQEMLRRLSIFLALAMVLAMALVAAPSHAGDDIRAGPTRTAKERLGGKASDEQRVDNCKVPPALRGPKPRPDECGDGASTRSHK